MSLLLSVLLLATTAVPASDPAPDDPRATTVTVAVDGATSTDGQVVVALFASDDGFPRDVKKADYKASGALEDTAATVEVSGVEPGPYAVLALHDENGDGEVETNWIGIPSEGLAMPNWTGGRPDFDESVVQVGPDATRRVDLTFRYR